MSTQGLPSRYAGHGGGAARDDPTIDQGPGVDPRSITREFSATAIIHPTLNRSSCTSSSDVFRALEEALRDPAPFYGATDDLGPVAESHR
jgi:hypothetical protein